MINGHFYYLNDEYYNKFQSCNLLGNKDKNESGEHNRPCFYCLQYNNLYWMIPLSSRIEKYKRLYAQKSIRYPNNFDGIRFGYVNGQERAFLIQNLCPTTEKYIESEYRIEKNTLPVTIKTELEKELNNIVKKVLSLYYNKGIKIVLTDLDTILAELSAENNSLNPPH